ncbi:hypothetical protein TNIN_263911, partial [Trichonephila inaurata madagascariensis]
PQPSSSTELTSPIPVASRGVKRRIALVPVGGPPKRPKRPLPCPTTEPTSPGPVDMWGPEPSSPIELTSPVPVASRGVKRRMALVPEGGSPKRPKKNASPGPTSQTTRDNDANHLETAEKSASSDKTGRSHCYNLRPRSKVDKVVMGLSLNCPSITDNKIETLKLSQPSCYNLRPRQKLSVKVDQKKDHLPKSRRRVQKKLIQQTVIIFLVVRL